MSTGRTIGRVAVAGALTRRASQGGHTWFLLQYILGFVHLGYDVVVVDRAGPDDELGVSRTADLLDGLGLAGRWSVLVDGTDRATGLSRRALSAELGAADLLLNVMGFLDDPDLLDVCSRRVFLDVDPGFPQLWDELGWADLLSGHDVHLTVGAGIGGPDCTIPDRGRRWLAILPPVVLDQWRAQSGRPDRVTTVASWRGPFGPIERGGIRHGLRVHEFRRFLAVARRTSWPLELALAIDPWDAADRGRLEEGGWHLTDPAIVAGDPEAYRTFVQGSAAEFTVAKEMYVRTRSGWFSDRSACYLASGRPVVAQDTGVCLVPTGEGLLHFADPDEAVAALEEVAAHYDRHSRAARALAESYLDSDLVLSRLIDVAGSATVPRAEALA